MTTIRILSLGGGTQSSALYLMALAGDVERPAAGVFADTGAEPPAVYDYLDYLESVGGSVIPILRVSAGDIARDHLEAVAGRLRRVATAPLHVRNDVQGGGDGTDRGGMLWRQCTSKYKLTPLRREMRRLMREAGASSVVQQIGISLDEIERTRDSGVKYITNVYPLVDNGLTRHDCQLWLVRRGHRLPGKSACFFCPYRSDRGWQAMQRDDPETFARACAFDDALRAGGVPVYKVAGKMYVHRSFTPLRMVKFAGEGQMTLWEQRDQTEGLAQECEGLCGT